MEVQRVAMSAIDRAKQLPGELQRFAQLERSLGALLVFTPALLIWVDSGPDAVRDSVSAYHDVRWPQAFYVPLTVGAMLFFVNGIVRRAHAYNAVLGLALLGVVLFDHNAATVPHTAFAALFFGGNVVVMMFFSTNKPVLLKAALAAGIAAAIGLWLLTDWLTLFWAEWVSLAIIATHFILDSASWSDYRALPAGQAPDLVP